MAIKKYLSLERLTEYDTLIKQEIVDGDNATLSFAKSYTDTKTSGLASTTVVDNKITAHNTSATAHSDIRDLISALTTKVNNFLDVDDTTTDQLSEVLELIENNKGDLESLTSGKVNVSDIVDNLTTSNASKVLSAKQGVALKALIDDLQEALDSHDTNTTKHITSTERTNWNAAKTHADSAHAPSNAQANVIETIKVNGTAQTVTSKSVNITVPTDNASLTNGAGYLVSSDIANKANKATTLSGYGITNAYTRDEVDAKTVVDNALSTSSTNPVQNKVVNSAISTLTSSVSTNTSSISAHNTAISNLQTALGNITDITSEEIQALFNA